MADRYIPVHITYETESGTEKDMQIPVAIDISKFLIKEKPSTYHNQLPYKTLK